MNTVWANCKAPRKHWSQDKTEKERDGCTVRKLWFPEEQLGLDHQVKESVNLAVFYLPTKTCAEFLEIFWGLSRYSGTPCRRQGENFTLPGPAYSLFKFWLRYDTLQDSSRYLIYTCLTFGKSKLLAIIVDRKWCFMKKTSWSYSQEK